MSRIEMTSKIKMTSCDRGIVLSRSGPMNDLWSCTIKNKQTSIPSSQKQHGITHTKQQCSIDTLSLLSNSELINTGADIDSIMPAPKKRKYSGTARPQKGNDSFAIGAIGNLNQLRSITFLDSRASQLYPIHLFWTQRFHRYSFLSSS